MTDTPQSNTDIADYRLAVERHLADLPAPIREDLLNGLEEHLAEVSADLEPGVPLSHLLGGPEAYARELRETVEIPKGDLAERFRRAILAPVADRLRGASDRFARGTGIGDFADLRKALEPGWWVFRGLIAAGLIAYFMVVSDEGVFQTLRELGFISLALYAALALFLVWLSLRLGTRSRRWGRRGQRIVAAGGVALFGAGLLSFAAVADAFMFGSGGPTMGYLESTSAPYGNVQDVYVYTEDGELLTGVYLFDQNGDPLYIGEPWACEEGSANNPFEREESATPEPFATTEAPLDEAVYGYRYPLCMVADEQGERDASDQSSAEPTEATTADPTAEATATEAPNGDPTTEAAESPSGESTTMPAQD